MWGFQEKMMRRTFTCGIFMKLYYLILPILIWGFFLPGSATPTDRFSAKNDKRWGITTKEPGRGEEDIKDEVEGKDADVLNYRKDNLDDEKMLDREQDSNTEVPRKNDGSGVENQTNENKNVERKSAKERQTDTTIPAKIKGINKKKAGEKSKEQKEKEKEKETFIKWKNEAQKTRCNGYLASLKETFLKARYYSIQGVPCRTAENAQSFMTLIEHCKRDCPDGLLEKQGYTSRIVRNLRWLNKLGTERCPDMNSN